MDKRRTWIMMPGLLFSPVCLTVIWFLSWSLCPSCAQIWTDEVSGEQYGHLESNVTLACNNSEIRLPVSWHLSHSTVLPWHQVTPNGSLVLLRVNHSAQGTYSCYDNSGRLLRSIKLRLGHPPGRLTISCQVPNHTHVRCSWVETVKTFLPAEYNASFSNGKEWSPCIVDVTQKHCDVVHPAFWQPIHTLRITETNALGSKNTTASVKLHELLKPDPPESVLVKELEGYPKKLLISWRFPSSWPQHDAFPLIFHIRYRPRGSIFWSEIYSLDNSIVIWDALAGHLHQVQVRTRDEINAESQWSEWSPLLLGRPWEDYTTPEPDVEPEDIFTLPTKSKPEASTPKSRGSKHGDEGNLGLVILLVLFSVVILTTIFSLIFVVWMRQRRRDHATKQELTSMVKMKSIPI
ncbi:interleukin-11 receptor subunit alpha isoform X1 [Neolamprologus brichardi]|nr:interleukin-11 receptor subunit alpha isoform X1 [Neolamprologus brichardi]